MAIATEMGECSSHRLFYALCEPYVSTDFLSFDSEEESPIWGFLLHHVKARREADEIIDESDEELFDFLRPYFTDHVLRRVENALIRSRFSSLGSSYLKRGTYATFVEALVEEIVAEYEGEEVAVTVTPAEEVDQTLVLDELSKTEKRRLSTDMYVHQDLDMADAGSNTRRPSLSDLIARRASEIFRSVVVRDILLPEEFRSPPRTPNSDERKETIREHSLLLCNLVKDVYVELPGPVYTPHMRASHAFLFHGTRVRHLDSFRAKGISVSSHKSDFSRSPSFYLTNSFRYAIEHVMLNVFREPEGDAVAVSCFKIPVEELERGRGLAVQYFPHDGARESWIDFIKKNRATVEPMESDDSSMDVTVGPIGVPYYFTEDDGGGDDGLPRRLRNRKTYIPVERIDGCRPLQVAFHTKGSIRWLSQFLHSCYIEVRPEAASHVTPLPL